MGGRGTSSTGGAMPDAKGEGCKGNRIPRAEYPVESVDF
jgi:hypothetical protein